MAKKITNKPASEKWWLLSLAVIMVGYLISHLWNLTGLPVFADESIYIRWSQLIIDDWLRYSFFALNDGKTPLQIWATVPSLLIFKDPLYAGRVVSVLAGAAQLLVTYWLTRMLGGRPRTALLSSILVAVLPYWFFHHRMALMDGWLAVWVTAAMAAAAGLSHSFAVASDKSQWKWTILLSLFLGLALWTKLPAILLIPALFFVVFLEENMSTQERILLGTRVAVGVVGGMLGFALMKLHPAFGQLFNRGGDFLYPIKDILMGQWLVTIGNFPAYFSYFAKYMTLPMLLLWLLSPFATKLKRSQLILWAGAWAFIGTIGIMGKVVYPRYFLPAVPFMTVSIVLAVQTWVDTWRKGKNQSLVGLPLILLPIVLMIANGLAAAVLFDWVLVTNPDKTDFVPADKVQYLHEWSSGHGILESLELIESLSQDQTLAVATEGFFGTLPDALLMYLHRQDVRNLSVDGIGQPVGGIPDSFILKARKFDQAVLVVNSHRMLMSLPPEKLLLSVCRPDDQPCLQVWDISDTVHNSPLQ
jgi:4-amino-4-deoxy-L-arabinose transferase-like glycosyltransferase